MNAKLLKLSNAIEELRLPTKGLRLRTQAEALLLVVDGTVFKGLYYAFKWARKGTRVVTRVCTAPLLLWAALALLVAYGF